VTLARRSLHGLSSPKERINVTVDEAVADTLLFVLHCAASYK